MISRFVEVPHKKPLLMKHGTRSLNLLPDWPANSLAARVTALLYASDCTAFRSETVSIKNARMIAPDAKTQAAILIRRMRGDRPVSELARALETSWPSAQRLEDPKHWPSLRQLEKAASALGKRLVLSFE
jgi:antitoxin HicB